MLASAEKLIAASPFLVASFTEISLLVVPLKTPNDAGGAYAGGARCSAPKCWRLLGALGDALGIAEGAERLARFASLIGAFLFWSTRPRYP
jgi:hypothetical protein